MRSRESPRHLNRLRVSPIVKPSGLARSYAWLVAQRWFLALVLVIAGVVTLSNLRSLSITILTDPVDQRLRVYVESTTELLSIGYASSPACC